MGHVADYARDARASSAQTVGVQSSAIRFAGVAGPRWVLKHAARLLDPGEQTFTSRLHTVGQEAVYVTTSNSHDATGTIVFRRGHYCGWVKVVRGGESGPPLGSVEALATEVDRRLHRLR